MFVDKICSEELGSPDKTTRLFAIEEAMHEGKTTQLLETLLIREKVESDEECKCMLSHAIEAVQTKIDSPGKNEFKKDEKLFQETFQKAVENEKVRILRSLSPKQIREFQEEAPRLLQKEKSLRIKTFILRTFSRQWPKESRSILFQLLETPNRSLYLACLKVLVRIAPRELVSFLPDLLLSTDVRHRGIALQVLVDFDLEEALAHFEELLFSKKADQQMTALASAFHFPFDRLKTYLYKFFIIEQNLEMLQMAGDFFLINPDPQVPFRLLELYEEVEIEKREFVNLLLSGVCKNIRDSGVMGGDFENFLQGLRDAISKKKRHRSTRELFQLIEDGEGRINNEIIELFTRMKEDPEILQLLKLGMDEPIPETTRSVLQTLLDPSWAPASDVPAPQGDDWKNLEPVEKVRKIAAFATSTSPQDEEFINEIMKDPNSPAELLAACLRTAEKRKLSNYFEAAEKLLKHPQEIVVAEAIVYLGTLNLDLLIPYLNRLKNSKQKKVQSSLVKLLRKYDIEQAVRTIELFLKSPLTEGLAIHWMFLLDFSLIRKILISFLETKPRPDVFQIGLSVFQSNPDPENLFYLLYLEKTLGGDYSEKVKKLREETHSTITQMRLLDKKQLEELERKNLDRFQQEMQRREKPAPAYSLKTIRKIVKEKEEKKSSMIAGIFSVLIVTGIGISLVAFIFTQRHSLTTRSSTSVSAGLPKTSTFPTKTRTTRTKIDPNFSYFNVPPKEMEKMNLNASRRADLLFQTIEQTKGKKR